ncbi:MAG: NADH-quinone oxidoreductase subunit C [Gemmatimonadota bacterium]|nr:MAG: NADH-quinone oxidoreductase subunit C [Gemmatimonadota bacterium]
MSDIEQSLREKFAEDVMAVSDFRGDLAITVRRERIADVGAFLLSPEGGAFAMMLDICGVDYLGREPRFEVVYHLMSLETKERVRIKAQVSEGDPTVPTVTHLWKAANWFEREVYDLFGITFSGHPDLRRILTHDEFVGHALRKDYPLDGRQELSRPTPFAEE